MAMFKVYIIIIKYNVHANDLTILIVKCVIIQQNNTSNK